MKSKFLAQLDIQLKPCSDTVWILRDPLIYYSESLLKVIIVPAGFQTDLASVPRIPIVFPAWGDRVHREAVLHDYFYRSDSEPVVDRATADNTFLEAMESRGVSLWIRYPMYAGVRAGGWGSYHKRLVGDELK